MQKKKILHLGWVVVVQQKIVPGVFRHMTRCRMDQGTYLFLNRAIQCVPNLLFGDILHSDPLCLPGDVFVCDKTIRHKITCICMCLFFWIEWFLVLFWKTGIYRNSKLIH